MDVTRLCEFSVLAETLKYSAAARQLHISQSTLSRHIQSLEEELGHPLFLRTTRETRLSEYGELYLPFARRIAAEHGRAVAALRAWERDRNARVDIGVAHTPDLYHAIDYIVRFQRAYPGVPIHISEGALTELADAFDRGRLNLVTMAYTDWEERPEEFIPAGRSRLVAVLSGDHPFAAYDPIPLQALERARLIVPEERSAVYRFLLESLERERVRPDIFYQGNISGAVQLLAESESILIQDAQRAKEQLREGLALRRLDPDIGYTFGLQYRGELSKNERAFVEFIRRDTQRAAASCKK